MKPPNQRPTRAAMMTAHLPASYLLAHVKPFGRGFRQPPQTALLPTVLAAGLAPDLDMLAFLFIDRGQIPHHDYWLHIPLFWALTLTGLWLAMRAVVRDRVRFRRCAAHVKIFAAAIFLHLVLDSYAAPVRWLYPLSNTAIELIHVPATQSHWVLSMILHWSFLAEITIWIGAAILLYRSRRTSKVV